MISTDWINHLHKGAHTHFTTIGPMHSRHCRGWRTVTRPWDLQIKERPPRRGLRSPGTQAAVGQRQHRISS